MKCLRCPGITSSAQQPLLSISRGVPVGRGAVPAGWDSPHQKNSDTKETGSGRTARRQGRAAGALCLPGLGNLLGPLRRTSRWGCGGDGARATADTAPQHPGDKIFMERSSFPILHMPKAHSYFVVATYHE